MNEQHEHAEPTTDPVIVTDPPTAPAAPAADPAPAPAAEPVAAAAAPAVTASADPADGDEDGDVLDMTPDEFRALVRDEVPKARAAVDAVGRGRLD